MQTIILPKKIELPFPPSDNTYYRSIWNHKRQCVNVLISKRGREYREAIKDYCHINRIYNAKLKCRLKFEIILHPPDNRVRDVFNYGKALPDALTCAGVWVDDQQVDDYHPIRGKVIKGGLAILTLSKIPQNPYIQEVLTL